ncbi:MAG: hypothetical protein WA322_23315 [Pseudolabrys sp.]
MTGRPLTVIVGTAFALGLIGHVDRASTQTLTTQHGLVLSAAGKKAGQARQRGVPGQIACTVPPDPAQLPSGNRLQLGWHPDGLRYRGLPPPHGRRG